MTKKKKKGWFDWAFEDSTENTSEETNDEATDDISVSNSSSEILDTGVASVSVNVPSTGDGVFDQKFFEFFQSVIAENNIPGIDYFEYREATTKMKGLADPAKYQMAFDNFKIADPNLTKETLLSSIDHYDKLLSNEETDFDTEMAGETQSGVIDRRDQAAQLQAENTDIYQQIQNLNEKITKNQEAAIKLNNEAAIAEVNIGQTAKNFTKTLTHVRTGLGVDKTKIGELVHEVKTA